MLVIPQGGSRTVTRPKPAPHAPPPPPPSGGGGTRRAATQPTPAPTGGAAPPRGLVDESSNTITGHSPGAPPPPPPIIRPSPPSTIGTTDTRRPGVVDEGSNTIPGHSFGPSPSEQASKLAVGTRLPTGGGGSPASSPASNSTPPLQRSVGGATATDIRGRIDVSAQLIRPRPAQTKPYFDLPTDEEIPGTAAGGAAPEIGGGPPPPEDPAAEPKERKSSGYTNAARQGIAAHTLFKNVVARQLLGPGWDTEQAIPGAGRADAINFAKREIVELKPDNPNTPPQTMRRADRQLQRYITGISRETHTSPRDWQGRVVHYIIEGDQIRYVDPQTGRVVFATLP